LLTQYYVWVYLSSSAGLILVIDQFNRYSTRSVGLAVCIVGIGDLGSYHQPEGSQADIAYKWRSHLPLKPMVGSDFVIIERLTAPNELYYLSW
jgi:hypothetical protein